MTNLMITDTWLIRQPIERDALAGKLPEALIRKIKLVGFTDSYHILVRLHSGSSVKFTLDEWMTEACLARIAWEAL